MKSRRKRAGRLYIRGRMWWVKYVDAADKYAWVSTGFKVGQEKEAEIFRQGIIEDVAAQRRAGVLPEKPLTVAMFAERRFQARQANQIVIAKDEAARFTNHVSPIIGSVLLADVTREHVGMVMASVMAKVRAKVLAPRTARHVYAELKATFNEAKKFLPINPCDFAAADLPQNVDEDPAWRRTAVFSAGEMTMLLSDPRIPVDRRVFWALTFLGAGERFGEGAAQTWGDYDSTMEPLGRLMVVKSYSTKRKEVGDPKTKVSREVPVHPILAEVLAGWRSQGWRELMGREPESSDLIVPSRRGVCRSANHMLKKFHQDLKRIGLRKRRQHDLRRTFISLCRSNGGQGDLLRFITHGPRRGNVFDGYTEWSWEALCREVAKLRINLSGYDVLFGRAQVVESESAALCIRSDYGMVDTRTVTVAVTVGASTSQNEVQISETPLDFSRGVLRGGRDLNPRPPA